MQFSCLVLTDICTQRLCTVDGIQTIRRSRLQLHSAVFCLQSTNDTHRVCREVCTSRIRHHSHVTNSWTTFILPLKPSKAAVLRRQFINNYVHACTFLCVNCDFYGPLRYMKSRDFKISQPCVSRFRHLLINRAILQRLTKE